MKSPSSIGLDNPNKINSSFKSGVTSQRLFGNSSGSSGIFFFFFFLLPFSSPLSLFVSRQWPALIYFQQKMQHGIVMPAYRWPYIRSGPSPIQVPGVSFDSSFRGTPWVVARQCPGREPPQKGQKKKKSKTKTKTKTKTKQHGQLTGHGLCYDYHHYCVQWHISSTDEQKFWDEVLQNVDWRGFNPTSLVSLWLRRQYPPSRHKYVNTCSRVPTGSDAIWRRYHHQTGSPRHYFFKLVIDEPRLRRRSWESILLPRALHWLGYSMLSWPRSTETGMTQSFSGVGSISTIYATST